MKTTSLFIKQWAILTVLMLVGMAAFLVLAGEETEPMSFGKFVAIKVAALAVFVACVLAGKYFNSKGLLPEIEE